MPANGKFLLDTNVIIALLEGDDAVLSNLDQAPEVFIPAVALGELFFGAAKSAVLLRTRIGWNDSRPAERLSHAISKSLANMDV
jgi:predicted nucleic acid-binding protein